MKTIKTYEELEVIAAERGAVIVTHGHYIHCGSGCGGHNRGMLPARYIINVPAQLLMSMLRNQQIYKYERMHPRKPYEEAIVKYELYVSKPTKPIISYWGCSGYYGNQYISVSETTKRKVVEKWCAAAGVSL